MNVLLVLNIDPRLEDDMADFLLRHTPGGFTTRTVHGHGEGLEAMSIAEQVSGRRRRLEFVLLLEAGEVDALLAAARDTVGGDIVWWEQSVLRNGRL